MQLVFMVQHGTRAHFLWIKRLITCGRLKRDDSIIGLSLQSVGRRDAIFLRKYSSQIQERIIYMWIIIGS